MPRPVSETTISARDFTRSSVTCTCPPSGVFLTAFERRFQTICCKRAESPATNTLAGLRTTCSAIAFASADGRMVSTAASMTGVSATAWMWASREAAPARTARIRS